jgi:hypothetical protein
VSRLNQCQRHASAARATHLRCYCGAALSASFMSVLGKPCLRSPGEPRVGRLAAQRPFVLVVPLVRDQVWSTRTALDPYTAVPVWWGLSLRILAPGPRSPSLLSPSGLCFHANCASCPSVRTPPLAPMISINSSSSRTCRIRRLSARKPSFSFILWTPTLYTGNTCSRLQTLGLTRDHGCGPSRSLIRAHH